MKYIKEDIIRIYQKERGILLLIALNLILSIILAIFLIMHLNPNAAVVKVGYSDLNGYQDGSWVDLLAWGILAIVLGILHPLLALKIYHRRGGGITKFFLITTTLLILGAFVVLVRISGEG